MTKHANCCPWCGGIAPDAAICDNCGEMVAVPTTPRAAEEAPRVVFRTTRDKSLTAEQLAA